MTSTYTYLLGDEATGEALLIDPVVEKADRDSHLIIDLGLTLKFAVNTHMHADHITGTHALKAKLGKGVVSVIAAAAGAAADLHVKEGDKLHFGSRYVTVIATPGHTNGCISFLMDDHSAVFTGDALFVRGCGRTDFQQGNSGALYDNLHAKIFTLPESTVVYPGHDYNGHLRSTVGEEKRCVVAVVVAAAQARGWRRSSGVLVAAAGQWSLASCCDVCLLPACGAHLPSFLPAALSFGRSVACRVMHACVRAATILA